MTARRFELLCFAFGFLVPFVLFYGASLAFSRSPLPLGQRLTTWEDTCPYYSCLIVPLASYVVVRLVAGFRRDFRRWRGTSQD